ncbi:terminal uridylyltransferase Tailor [Anopheles nili]|uniref:terminal uridylyltransferase Tailor n=1 Tax=Anopheles nili TaxID=185578 RepID=UPI00237B6D75|nr:terminal uridylyltransferase Tailor [Anopheles nili]
MSKGYMSTNVMMHALMLNLECYEPGPKAIDTFTLSQIEKLLQLLENFLAESQLVSLGENETEKDMLMSCYYQQPNVVRCRFCTATYNEYDGAVKHMKKHERHKKHEPEVDSAVVKGSFMEKKCIPRSGEVLSKKMKKFLSRDHSAMIQKIRLESKYVQTDDENMKAQQALEQCLRKSYPSVKCYHFGSRVAGTGSFTSDLDVFVDLYDVYNGRKNKVTAEELSDSVEKVQIILQNSSEWIIEAIVLNARVPLLRVFNPNFDIKCDLTFSNGLAHRNSVWLQYMFNLQPTSRLLVCYLKEWNRECCLNSYTLSLMVIFFFQCHNLLPSVASLQNDPTCDVIIDDWNGGISMPSFEELHLESCEDPVLVLSKRFFEFYSLTNKSFSLETHVVCPLLGHTGVSKKMFDGSKLENIPPEMQRLRRYMLDHQNDKVARNQFYYDKPFVVQDPFELCHNVAKSIPVDAASRLLRSFHLSAAFKGN